MALVFVGAIHQYFLDHPKGVMPGQHYLRAYIKPFTDLHTLEARMNPLSQHERELAEGQLMMLRKACADRIGPKMTRDKNG